MLQVFSACLQKQHPACRWSDELPPEVRVPLELPPEPPELPPELPLRNLPGQGPQLVGSSPARSGRNP